MRRICFIVVSALLLGLCGCSTDIPPELQVKDVGSGRIYTTYQPWGDVTKGIGYSFVDIESGNHITLTNYELKTIEGEKKVPSDSVDAKAFKEAKKRGGVK